MRILVAGFQHETNTFAPTRAAYENFVRGEGFPPIAFGNEVLALRTVNIPLGGFVQAIEAEGHVAVPVVWAGACPSAQVTRDAFERIAGLITDAAMREDIDAIYLDLHGAMVADHVEDGEGELLSRLRRIVGRRVPIVASLDLHANVTEQMLAEADGLIAFRTYPHIDMAETGRRSADFLLDILRDGRKPLMFARRVPFLIPINGMCTGLEPARSIYMELARLEATGLASLSFAPGFPSADFPGCGPVVWGYGHDPEGLFAAVEALSSRINRAEDQWRVAFLDADAAVEQAMQLAERASRPVVIADTQDNPTAGGNSNTTGLLRALVQHGVADAALGLIWDPDAARDAHEAGVGATLRLSLGGTSGAPGDRPFHGVFAVSSLSDGLGRFEGPMLTGTPVDLGPTACLAIDGVRVVVSSNRVPMIDRTLFRLVGIQPETMRVLVVKSSVHFRADFEPIAEAILVAAAPGPFIADPEKLPWRHLPRGLRTGPNGPAFEGRPRRRGSVGKALREVPPAPSQTS